MNKQMNSKALIPEAKVVVKWHVSLLGNHGEYSSAALSQGRAHPLDSVWPGVVAPQVKGGGGYIFLT